MLAIAADLNNFLRSAKALVDLAIERMAADAKRDEAREAREAAREAKEESSYDANERLRDRVVKLEKRLEPTTADTLLEELETMEFQQRKLRTDIDECKLRIQHYFKTSQK